MTRLSKIISILLAVVLCVLFVVSVIDTNETRKETNFSQENMLVHVNKLSEFGPHSLFDKENIVRKHRTTTTTFF